MTNQLAETVKNKAEIRQLVENWAEAVRKRDLHNVLAYHSDDIVMFDVPKPFQSIGMDAYRKTGDNFLCIHKTRRF